MTRERSRLEGDDRLAAGERERVSVVLVHTALITPANGIETCPG
jgi:hypothetical protein